MGVGIQVGASHAALCFSDGLAERILELRFHHRVVLCPVPKGMLVADLEVPALRQPAMRVYFERVASKAGAAVPYGVTIPHDQCFDSVTGAWLLGPFGPGLTCATFVIAVLKRLGLEFVATDTWMHRPEDALWRDEIIALLRKHNMSEQADFVERQDRCVRIRPIEVAGAATVPQGEWPVNYARAIDRADAIRPELVATASR